MCKGDDGIIEVAQVADHIIPAKWDVFPFHEKLNLWGICKKCHARKSKLEGEMSTHINISKFEAVQDFMRKSIRISKTLQKKLSELLIHVAD